MSEQTTFAPKLRAKLAQEQPELLPLCDWLDNKSSERDNFLREVIDKSLIRLGASLQRPTNAHDVLHAVLTETIGGTQVLDILSSKASELHVEQSKSKIVETAILPYIEEYYQTCFERLRTLTTAMHRGEPVPRDALKADEITSTDVAGFVFYGSEYPEEIWLYTGNTTIQKQIENALDPILPSPMTLAGFLERLDRLKSPSGILPLPKHLQEALQQGKTSLKELRENTKELSDALSTIFSIKPALRHLSHEVKAEEAARLQQAEERLAEIKSDPNFLYHPFVTLKERNENGSKNYDSIFFGLLSLGEDEWAQTILDEGYRADALNGNQDACCRFAVDRCSLETMQLMHKRGFDFTRPPYNEDSLLFTAIRNRDPAKLEQLLEWGCDPVAFDREGTSPVKRVHSIKMHDATEAELLVALLRYGGGQIAKWSPEDTMITLLAPTKDAAQARLRLYQSDDESYNLVHAYVANTHERFDHFIANAKALRDPYGDGLLPHPDAPSPLNLSRQDVIDLYTIGKLQDALQEKYWVYNDRLDNERLDGIFRLPIGDPKRLPDHIDQLYMPHSPAIVAELSRTAPEKPLGSWTALVSNLEGRYRANLNKSLT